MSGFAAHRMRCAMLVVRLVCWLQLGLQLERPPSCAAEGSCVGCLSEWPVKSAGLNRRSRWRLCARYQRRDIWLPRSALTPSIRRYPLDAQRLIHPMKVQGDKLVRAAAAEPTISAGRVMLPEGAPWADRQRQWSLGLVPAPRRQSVAGILRTRVHEELSTRAAGRDRTRTGPAAEQHRPLVHPRPVGHSA